MDLVLDRPDERGGIFERALDANLHLIHLAVAVDLDHKLVDRVEPPNDVLDGARKEVHPADDQHVVNAADDPALQAMKRAAAAARLAGESDPVARSVPNVRMREAAKGGDDELTFIARLAGLRVEHLEETLGFVEMDA